MHYPLLLQSPSGGQLTLDEELISFYTFLTIEDKDYAKLEISPADIVGLVEFKDCNNYLY